MPQIPVTIFTGFLGSGKTTILRNLIKDLPLDYSTCLLKNEYGDLNVDSMLLKESNIKVQEMINGCLCCVLVGKLQNALKELLNKYSPDRIFIETSGSALPAPIALEINKIPTLKVDGIINVVDVLNFQAYKDTSYTAKIQAQFTDLIILNKWELTTQNIYEEVLDSINELNSITPKVKSSKGYIKPDVIFGLDSSLISKTSSISISHPDQHSNEFDLIEIAFNSPQNTEDIISFIKELPKWDFYRIKGYLSNNDKSIIINCVFGRLTIEEFVNTNTGSKLLFIGKNFAFHINKIKEIFKLSEKDYVLTLAKRD